MDDASRGGSDGDEDVMSLVRLAGARPTPSAERTADARAYFDAAWRAEARRRRARALLLQAAAVLATVAALALALRQARAPLVPAVVAARLDAAASPVEAECASGWEPLAVGGPLPVGCRVRTAAGGAGLRVDDGRSVRLAARSRLRWDAVSTLTLESGAVYVDSGVGHDPAAPFEVRTSWGAVRETGTQFEVRLEPAALRVRVREGRVSVFGRAPAIDIASGSELLLDERESKQRTTPVHGPDWSWTMALAPAFEIDGRAPHDMLVWAAREAGWELRYVDDESRRRAQASQLHGSIRGLRTDEAVIAVLPSTGLPHRLQDGVLWIGPSGKAADSR